MLSVRWVVTYVLGARCVVYVKGLGETYVTLDTRQTFSCGAVPDAAEVDTKQNKKKAGARNFFEI